MGGGNTVPNYIHYNVKGVADFAEILFGWFGLPSYTDTPCAFLIEIHLIRPDEAALHGTTQQDFS